MALIDVLQRRVHARKREEDVEDFEGFESELQTDQEASGAESSAHNVESSESLAGDELSDNRSENSIQSNYGVGDLNPQDAFSSISFGALASAQASLGIKRKRSSNDDLPINAKRHRSPSPFHEADERRAGKKASQPASARISKHAPTEISSKKAVSRKRSVIAVPTVAPRDPRFLSLSGKLDTNKVNQNYSFLNDYRASEITDLKSQIRGTKDGAEREALKKQLKAMEDRERTRQRDEREKAIVREHRKGEKKRVEEGKKPFYLKKSEVKRQTLVKMFEGMGEKRVEKLMEKRRKKKASKERKAMPNARRGPERSI